MDSKESNCNNNDAIDFTVIEKHKENIIPLRQGRDLSQLLSSLSLSQQQHTSHSSHPASAEATISDYHRRIKLSSDIDDPLQVHIEFVQWIQQTYPQSNDAQSELITALENATKAFIKDPRYQNDHRYLRLWLLYASFSDNPILIFRYLSSNGIGISLATYYEEYGLLLLQEKRFSEADKVFRKGIERNAQPVERLQRKYEAFLNELNLRQKDTSSLSNISQPRPALQEKSHSVPSSTTSLTSSVTPSLSSNMVQVYLDATSDSEVNPLPENGTWKDLGTRTARVKENIQLGEKWQGITLKQDKTLIDLPSQSSSVLVYKDTKLDHRALSLERDKKNDSKLKRPEKITCKMETLYDSGVEYCFEEIRAQLFQYTHPSSKFISVEEEEMTIKLRPPSPTINTKAALKDVMEMFSQPLNTSTATSLQRSFQKFVPPDTICREATDDGSIESEEITKPLYQAPIQEPFSIFQDQPASHTHKEFESSSLYQNENFTSSTVNSDAETYSNSRNTTADSFQGPLSTVKESSILTSEFLPKTPGFNIPCSFDKEHDDHNNIDSRMTYFQRNKVDILTPLTEVSEVSTLSTTSQLHQSFWNEYSTESTTIDSKASHLEYSPPFLKTSKLDELRKQTVQLMDRDWQESIREAIYPVVSRLALFHNHDTIWNQTDVIDKASMVVKSKRYSSGAGYSWKNKMGGVTYGMVKKLGQGGYATVYLVDHIQSSSRITSDTSSSALKLQRPGDTWEFYILNEVKRRLESAKDTLDAGQRLSEKSILFPTQFHLFHDESGLLMPFCDQSTLLDIINGYSAKNMAMEEVAVMFYTVRLLAFLESLHLIGILHGDIKPDNILLRFGEENQEDDTSPIFQSDGEGGWGHKGVYVLDFGRSVDLELFPTGMKFLADIKDSNEHCKKSSRHRKGEVFEDVLDYVQGLPGEEPQSWSFELDYYGLCNVVHTMLFGRYLELAPSLSTSSSSTTTKLKLPFKRYWQESLWTNFFQTLLNPYASHQPLEQQEHPVNITSLTPPLTSEASVSLLRHLRQEMESTLEQTSNQHGKNLKAILRKHEIFKFYKTL